MIFYQSLTRQCTEKKHYKLIMIYAVCFVLQILLPRPRVLKLATGTSHFTAITYITAHACRIIPPPCNSESPSVALSPREVPATFLFFSLNIRSVSETSEQNESRKTRDDVGQCDKREKVRVDGNVDL